MADIFSKDTRTIIMRAVKSKNNKTTELRLISLFQKNGIVGWRRNYQVKGHPDFVFVSKRVAVFVDGCFWHGHDCRNTRPSDNRDYWVQKRARNIKHDAEVNALFEKRGWKVLRIWECELKKKNEAALIGKIKETLTIEKY